MHSCPRKWIKSCWSAQKSSHIWSSCMQRRNSNCWWQAINWLTSRCIILAWSSDGVINLHHWPLSIKLFTCIHSPNKDVPQLSGDRKKTSEPPICKGFISTQIFQWRSLGFWCKLTLAPTKSNCPCVASCATNTLQAISTTFSLEIDTSVGRRYCKFQWKRQN